MITQLHSQQENKASASNSCKRTSSVDIQAVIIFAVFSSNLKSICCKHPQTSQGLYIHLCPCQKQGLHASRHDRECVDVTALSPMNQRNRDVCSSRLAMQHRLGLVGSQSFHRPSTSPLLQVGIMGKHTFNRHIIATGSQCFHTSAYTVVTSACHTFHNEHFLHFFTFLSVSRRVEDVSQGNSCSCSDSALLLLSPPRCYWRQRLLSLNSSSILQPY